MEIVLLTTLSFQWFGNNPKFLSITNLLIHTVTLAWLKLCKS